METRIYLAGNWKETKEQKDIISPLDLKILNKVYLTDENDWETALNFAHNIFSETKSLSTFERIQGLKFISKEIEKNISNFNEKNMSKVFGVYNSRNEEPLTINEIEKYLLSEKLL